MADSKGFAAILVPSILAVIVGAVLIVVGIFVTSIVANSASATINAAAANGTINFTGNATQGNYVNITNSGSYRLCFLVVSGTCSTGDIPVGLNPGDNSSAIAAQALANRINANTSLSTILTATNGSSGRVWIAYKTTGTAGNAVITTTNATNASWASGTLTGGVDGNAIYSATLSSANTNVSTSFILLGVILIVGGAGGIILTLKGFLPESGRT